MIVQGLLQLAAAICASLLLGATWPQSLGIFLAIWAVMPQPRS